jgi:hypothetical protein
MYKSFNSMCIGALIFVFISWIVFLMLAVRAIHPADVRQISSLGQFGDVFGSVNALFTGLALVGVVYTVLLQRDQVKTQDEQLSIQKVDSAKQAREQFLTARLNALVAQAQVRPLLRQPLLEASEAVKAANEQVYLRTLSKLYIRIEVLYMEAGLGFDGGPWTPSVEREAIRRSFLAWMRWFADTCTLAKTDDNRAAMMECLRATCQKLDFASAIYLEQYPDISRLLDETRSTLEKSVDVNIETWVDFWKGGSNLYLPGTFPWI